MACVILKEGMEMTGEELKDYVRTHMVNINAQVCGVCEGVSMNAAGKIMKYKMREWAVEYLGLTAESRIETA